MTHTRIRDLIISVVGETEAADIDLERVEVMESGALSVGDPDRDGTVVVSGDDTVTVWAQGDPHTSQHVPGAYEALQPGREEKTR